MSVSIWSKPLPHNSLSMKPGQVQAHRSGWAPSEVDVAAEAMVSLWQQRALDLDQLVRRAVMGIACGLFGNAYEETR